MTDNRVWSLIKFDYKFKFCIIIDDQAQIKLDFLFGVAIFLVAFLYVFTCVSGLFVPYQASAVDLSAVVYKTSTMLVEDPGWYIFSSNVTEVGDQAWETANQSQLARIGLADDKTEPNILSINKINALNCISSYDLMRDKIGLNGSNTYNFSMFLAMNNTLSHQYVTLLNISPAIQSNNVESMDRVVLVDTGRELFLNGYNPNWPTSAMDISIMDMSAFDRENVTIRIYNTSGIIDHLMWQDAQFDLPVPMIYRSQYIVRKNGVDMPVMPVVFNGSDIVEIIVYNQPMRDLEASYVLIYATSSIFPGNIVDYYGDPVYPLKSVCYPAEFRIGVWSNG